MSVAEGLYRFKRAMFDLLPTMLPDLPADAVFWGNPNKQPGRDLVMVGLATATIEPANMSPRRSREETATLEVTFVSARNEEHGQRVSEDRVFEMVGQVEHYTRMTNETLGGVVRDCLLTGLDTEGVTDPSQLAQGRISVLVATFTAHIRITG